MFPNRWLKHLFCSHRTQPLTKQFRPNLEVPENRRLLATIVVNTTMDELTANDRLVSLREAIQAINAGSDGGDANITAARTGAYGTNDTIILPAGTFKITIAPSGGDDNTTGDFNVLKAVTIQGAGAGSTIIDGNGLDRVFTFGDGGVTAGSFTATINDVTIRGGFISSGRGGGIQVNDTSADPITLNVNNSTIRNNTVGVGDGDGDGGGINSENGPITLTNCTVRNNKAADDGGGVNEKGAGTLTVINCTIRNNLAFSTGNDSDGGGLDNEGGGNIVVMNSIVTGNRASGDGGGIDSHKHPGDITIINSIVAGNTTFSTFGDIGGGGIAQEDNGKLTISNCLIAGNRTSLSGGGLTDGGTGDATITGSEITGNIAETDGGGLFLNTLPSNQPGAARLSISSSTFSYNKTQTGNGGGLDLETTAAGSTLINVTISDNTARGNGGGIFNQGTLTVSDSTLSDNSASAGGGIFNSNGTVKVKNSTFSHNTPDNIAGGFTDQGGNTFS
jgi:hypothetical protein